MIEIFIYKKDDILCGFKVSGHAGYADYGNDIVCSAVSILSINTVNSIETFTDSVFSLTNNEKKGLIDFRIKSEVSSDALLLLKSFELGIIQIGTIYSDYVSITYKEV